MRFQLEHPGEDVVTSTHVVAFVDGRVIMCRIAGESSWFLPGGTREPDENALDALARELLEEAGTLMRGEFHPIGAHVGVSEAPQPYRPHLPHPRQAWLWGWAEAEIVGPPTVTGGSERVEEVRTFAVGELRHLDTGGAPWLPELVMLAADHRAAFRRQREANLP